MLNLIRADFYRLTRGKTLYATLAGVIVLAGLVVLPPGGGGVFGMSMQVAMEYPNGPMGAGVMLELTGVLAFGYLFASTYSLAYLLVLVVLSVAVAGFSGGAVRNSTAAGIERKQYYLSTLVTSCALTVVLLLVFTGAGVGLATIVHGPGDWSTLLGPRTGWASSEPWQLTVFQLIMGVIGTVVSLLAMTSVGVCLSFVVRNNVALLALLAVLVFLPRLVGSAAMLTQGLFQYDLASWSVVFALPLFVAPSPLMMGTGFGIPGALVGLAGWTLLISGTWISATTRIGLGRFTRMDIR